VLGGGLRGCIAGCLRERVAGLGGVVIGLRGIVGVVIGEELQGEPVEVGDSLKHRSFSHRSTKFRDEPVWCPLGIS
jgi:hypothetical protein